MPRKLALLIAIILLPGALVTLFVLLLARMLARTARGRQLIERFARRFRAKDLPRLGNACPEAPEAKALRE